jgi:ubiquinone/menaquinone biosynthesis C-methylase UbiE
MQKKRKKETTSWEGVSSWYDKAVGKSGHYYHQKLVLPKVLEMLELTKNSKGSLLDLACGQGIISRCLPEAMDYQGVDISPSLIKSAREQNERKNGQFLVSDITKPLSLAKKDFDYCTILLAVQNLETPLNALKNAAKHLSKGGTILLMMNHPCFRIPRQSSWGIDEERSIQYRRVDKYSSSMKIPILSNPSLGKKSATTFSFHHPLSQWTKWLFEAGFAIEWMEELSSDKVSTGKYAKREDVSRKEFPLFLAVRAIKF